MPNVDGKPYLCEQCGEKIPLKDESLVIVAYEPEGTVAGAGEGGSVNLMMHGGCAAAFANTAKVVARAHREAIQELKQSGVIKH